MEPVYGWGRGAQRCGDGCESDIAHVGVSAGGEGLLEGVRRALHCRRARSSSNMASHSGLAHMPSEKKLANCASSRGPVLALLRIVRLIADII